MSLRQVKSVSLSDQTMRIADGMSNFSAFVRAALLDYDDRRQTATPDSHHPDSQFGGVCNAMRPALCAVCYPRGRPSQSDWLEYVCDVRLQAISQPEAFAKLQLTIQPRTPDRVDDMLPTPANFAPKPQSSTLKAKFMRLWPFR